MFDVDAFLTECVACLDETDPRRAIRELLTRTMSRPEELADRFRPETAGITKLYQSPRLTVLNVVWAPKMRLYAHDHRMWASIAIYAGREDNEFFRRPAGGAAGLVESGRKRLDVGDVTLLGDDTIHAVTNPKDVATAAIHVYGGDFFNQPRSQWRPPQRVEEPYDMVAVSDVFKRANDEWKAASSPA
jgi:predicted metal-dependent enzyme (double-stranded beta helix superfamily)